MPHPNYHSNILGDAMLVTNQEKGLRILGESIITSENQSRHHLLHRLVLEKRDGLSQLRVTPSAKSTLTFLRDAEIAILIFT
jgi:hypothetical protein